MSETVEGQPETGGGFVEIDRHKLSPPQIYMLGCKETLELWIEEFQTKARENAPNIIVAQVLMECAGRMKISHDALAVELTKSCCRTGAATIHNAFGKKIQ